MSKVASPTLGFTLIELLVAVAIIGILSTVLLGGFRSSQVRARDAQRKANLKQISEALELFYSDYKKYPSSTDGVINACPYNSAGGTGSPCSWGDGEFKDIVSATDTSTKTIYFKTLPADPSIGEYYYKSNSSGSRFQLYAHLENTEDKNCISDDCTIEIAGIACGTGLNCNFSITSANTTPTEE